MAGSFNVKGDDGNRKAVVLEVGAGTTPFPKDRPVIDWQLTVVTADSADAAFDGAAHLTLCGNDGSSDELLLSNDSASNFGVGSVSVFKIKQPSYEGIRYLQLRADFTGAATTWNLARIELVNLADSSKTLFAYNSCLNTWSTTAYLWPQSSYTCKVWGRPVRSSPLFSSLNMPLVTRAFLPLPIPLVARAFLPLPMPNSTPWSSLTHVPPPLYLRCWSRQASCPMPHLTAGCS